MPHLVSVNTSESRRLDDRLTSSIDKRPRAGRVPAGRLGLEGDTVTDHRHHGGPDQAVYAYAQEELDHWTEQLGEAVTPGMFGENLTVAGHDLGAALLGERWRVGDAVLEVRTVRIPCNTFKRWLGIAGYDDTAWVKRFTARADPGVYLAVVQEGEVTAGDTLDVAHLPDHGVTAADFFRALTTHKERLPDLLATPGLPQRVYDEGRAALPSRSTRTL